MEFSANLGFLWTELTLPEAIRAAHRAGFAAVECHWPYGEEPQAVAEALAETGLPMLGLNTSRGDVAAGENGLSALPGRETEAREAIDAALSYAEAVGADAVHVMAGFAEGPAAQNVFLENLRYGAEAAARTGHTLLIEPLNRFDAPGYFLRTTEQAAEILGMLGAPRVKLMFDCYHVGRTEGDVITCLRAVLPLVGHIQFAAVPSRGAPDTGELDYAEVFSAIAALGWSRPLGAEYKPGGATEASLDWLAGFGALKPRQ